VFVLGKHFQPNLVSAGQAEPSLCSTNAFSLTRKYYVKLKVFARYRRSSLFCHSFSIEEKVLICLPRGNKVIKLFCLFLTLELNKLECLSMADFSGQSVNTSGFYKCGALWVSLLTSPANNILALKTCQVQTQLLILPKSLRQIKKFYNIDSSCQIFKLCSTDAEANKLGCLALASFLGYSKICKQGRSLLELNTSHLAFGLAYKYKIGLKKLGRDKRSSLFRKVLVTKTGCITLTPG